MKTSQDCRFNKMLLHNGRMFLKQSHKNKCQINIFLLSFSILTAKQSLHDVSVRGVFMGICPQNKNTRCQQRPGSGTELKDQSLHLYLNSAVVRVQQQLGQSNNLRCAVPAVRAVHQDGPVVSVHSVDHQQCRLQQQGQMLQPLGALQCRKPAADTQTATEPTYQRTSNT